VLWGHHAPWNCLPCHTGQKGPQGSEECNSFSKGCGESKLPFMEMLQVRLPGEFRRLSDPTTLLAL
jgi:hypothetical protein